MYLFFRYGPLVRRSLFGNSLKRFKNRRTFRKVQFIMRSHYYSVHLGGKSFFNFREGGHVKTRRKTRRERSFEFSKKKTKPKRVRHISHRG